MGHKCYISDGVIRCILNGEHDTLIYNFSSLWVDGRADRHPCWWDRGTWNISTSYPMIDETNFGNRLMHYHRFSIGVRLRASSIILYLQSGPTLISFL